jgi:hypothetical protein
MAEKDEAKIQGDAPPIGHSDKRYDEAARRRFRAISDRVAKQLKEIKK